MQTPRLLRSETLLTLLIGVLFLVGCGNSTVTLGYDESVNDPILEADLQKSPRANVEAFLADAGVTALDIGIHSSPAKDCACGKDGSDCLCMLRNTGGYGQSCADATAMCKVTKYIEVSVYPEDADALTAVGFVAVQ